MLHHAVDISKEADVPQLIYLIMSDRLNLQLAADILQIVEGRREGSQAGARERNLGRGRELIDQVRISRAFALCQNLNQMILGMIIQMMDRIGVVPVNPEIFRRRLQPRAICL